MKAIVSNLGAGGHLIASGIMGAEKEMVLDSFTRCGLDILQIKEEDEWVAVLFRKTE